MKNNWISKEDIAKNETFFLYHYISWFRGYDEDLELNMDEVLDKSLDIDLEEFTKWHSVFFEKEDKFIGGKLTKNLSFCIEFLECERAFFINDIYIGNLGGHFVAWFLTLDELLAFDKYKYLFLLMLPMVGIEPQQEETAREMISQHLKTIPKFKENSDYIAQCIVNGLIVETPFVVKEGIGLTNSQNHNVRNANEDCLYLDELIKLNKSLEEFVRK